jgi:hypothetical protein
VSQPAGEPLGGGRFGALQLPRLQVRFVGLQLFIYSTRPHCSMKFGVMTTSSKPDAPCPAPARSRRCYVLERDGVSTRYFHTARLQPGQPDEYKRCTQMVRPSLESEPELSYESWSTTPCD